MQNELETHEAIEKENKQKKEEFDKVMVGEFDEENSSSFVKIIVLITKSSELLNRFKVIVKSV